MTASEHYEVFALRYARMPQRRAHDNFMHRDVHDGPMPMDFFIWIVRNAHRVILIDTGFGARASASRGRPLDIDPVDALERIGIPAEGVSDIVLTHLHYDHAGNLDRFPNATVHVQDAEMAFATGRCMCHSVMRYPYDVDDVVTCVRRVHAGRVCFHDGDAEIFPGVSVHLLPGHSKGLQAVKVATARGPVLLASDASHYYANFERSSPFVITIDVAATLESYARMRQLVESDEHIIPGHDPLVGERYPSRVVNGVTLIELHVAPD
ncbi:MULTISPECIES: N-acyl homoserine lactonase family protein [unclassified Bosea (in: a-proteobacteria)]|uniref:N-acyl homoserine lactonase family protein n=1 Tax=unclassified Bosea (in: a-proteobacteria) TaxID=2653178 RepID=UPI0009555F1A|nr:MULTISPECIES: N-acyl homoserine lactonase family protein [unclassified Bosea (in: a-proteobacteria)]TAJ27901.1 MAG: N-acyl homoserine lactonase family protein [Bosea sp. (in: a-proteobacteria)]SIR30483.1 Glyoxylase, beta-lactamase superfamily II [Bosea sp. TND4EK4]